MVSNLITRAVSVLLLLGATDLMAGNPASTQYVQQNQGGGSTPSGTTYTVGQYAQGGVIFWVTLDGQHGLVASIENMPSGTGITYEWSPNGQSDLIGATGNDITIGIGADGKPTTTGKINSALIVDYYTLHPVTGNPPYAAGVCAAYSHVGYTDWYLPCLAELGLMMSMQSTIDYVSRNHGGSGMGTFQYYWSSFEGNTGYAWCQNFLTADQLNTYKVTTNRVRAVRAF
jgi:hypothetical protein